MVSTHGGIALPSCHRTSPLLRYIMSHGLHALASRTHVVHALNKGALAHDIGQMRLRQGKAMQ